MASGNDDKQKLIKAVALARKGAWDEAHHMVQSLEGDSTACWIHGVLHKIEGDEVNARYWYERCDHSFDEFSDVSREWAAIEEQLSLDLHQER